MLIKMKCSFAKKNFRVPDVNRNPWPSKYQLCALTIELRETLGELGYLSWFIRDMRPAYCLYHAMSKASHV